MSNVVGAVAVLSAPMMQSDTLSQNHYAGLQARIVLSFIPSLLLMIVLPAGQAFL